MLKITYLEDEIRLEHLSQPIEVWKSDRILVNLRAAASVYLESSVASLIFAIDSYIRELVELASKELIDIFPCDEECIEVALSGTWVAENQSSEVGIFVCELSPDSERCLYKLWQESQIETSAIGE